MKFLHHDDYSKKSFLTVVLGDLNIKLNLWFKGNATSNEGSKPANLKFNSKPATTCQFELPQKLMRFHILLQIPLLVDLTFNISILYLFYIHTTTKFCNGGPRCTLPCKLSCNLCNLSSSKYKIILSDFIPCEIITCDHKDLLWMNKNIKQLLLGKNQASRSYLRSNKLLKNNVRFFKRRNSLIQDSKEKYYVGLSNSCEILRTAQSTAGQF